MKKRAKQAVQAKKTRMISPIMRQRFREVQFLCVVAIAVFLLIALFTYHAEDPAWSLSNSHHMVHNSGGKVGAWVSDVLLSVFGGIAYVLPILLIFSYWRTLDKEAELHTSIRDVFWSFLAWLVLIASTCPLATLLFSMWSFDQLLHWPAGPGGFIGDLCNRYLHMVFNTAGSLIVLLTMLLAGLVLLTGISWMRLLEQCGETVVRSFQACLNYIRAALQDRSTPEPRPPAPKSPVPPAKIELVKTEAAKASKLLKESEALPKVVPMTPPVRPIMSEAKKSLTSTKPIAPLKTGELPSLNLLQESKAQIELPFQNVSFESLALMVESRLADFGVDAKVQGIYPGPIITRFELDLAPGVKVSKVMGLAKDIARSLSTTSVRVVEVIPGKSYVGLEVPNESREIVMLRDVLASDRYQTAASCLSLALGKDIAGDPVVVDLAKMPHLLVAGTTGSGKSVSLNTMLLSLLFKASPDEVRLVLIDPKMLELSVYEGIPHLLTPVITDMKDAANALRWCVAEMDKRYRLMAALGVRSLASYNAQVQDAARLGEPLYMPGALVQTADDARTQLKALPMIVVIIDELADMMMVVGKKVEDLIARIAQKARAAGIHLILATQRPSVDVITGLIKANIPTRIAFQVSSRIDSRTILDQQGAEQLLGHGDMLYLPPGAGVPSRVHGAYVSDEEVHRVVAAWRTLANPVYEESITADESDGAEGGDNGSADRDPLYQDVVKIVQESNRASISLVQRRLRIGYNRAARLMEELEAAGIVSTMDHSGSREVLVRDES